MSTEQMREAFEAWCASDNPRYHAADDSQLNRRDWKVWQAALEAQLAAQPDIGQLEYMGNSVAYWRNKALAYRDRAGEAFENGRQFALKPMATERRKAIMESAINGKSEMVDMEYVAWIIEATERAHGINAAAQGAQEGKL